VACHYRSAVLQAECTPTLLIKLCVNPDGSTSLRPLLQKLFWFYRDTGIFPSRACDTQGACQEHAAVAPASNQSPPHWPGSNQPLGRLVGDVACLLHLLTPRCAPAGICASALTFGEISSYWECHGPPPVLGTCRGRTAACGKGLVWQAEDLFCGFITNRCNNLFSF